MTDRMHQTYRHGDHVLAARVRVVSAGTWPIGSMPTRPNKPGSVAVTPFGTCGTFGTSPAQPARHLGPST